MAHRNPFIIRNIHAGLTPILFTLPLVTLTHCRNHGSDGSTLLTLLGSGSIQTEASKLRTALARNGVTPLVHASTPSGASLALGEALFFDRIVSGPKNISCATCHHPALVAGDTLTLPVGVGGTGIGQLRQMQNASVIIHRNAPEIHNRTAIGWKAMFWDGRVREVSSGIFNTPAGPANANLPSGLKNIAAVQALFPMLSRTEMLGFHGGPNDNDLADLDAENNPASVWNGIMDRLRAIPGYVTLLQNAYPSVNVNSMGIEYAANAIADYEGDLWNTTRATGWTVSPFNAFLKGKDDALNESAVRGGLLFFEKAGCGNCHNGPLLSDMDFHNIAAPQLGPGFGSGAAMNPPRDYGRFEITGNDADRYRFRTAPLSEVPYTGPYLHNGSLSSLQKVIEHHLSPASSLATYNVANLPAEYADLYVDDPAIQADMLNRLDAKLNTHIALTNQEMNDLVSFIQSLGSPTTLQLGSKVPTSVPSGLPVDQ